MKKISKMLVHLPATLTLVLAAALSVLSGMATARINVISSEIVGGFEITLFKSLVIACLLIVPIEFFMRVLIGAGKTNIVNAVYLKELERVSKSKMADINKLTSGKIFGLVQEKASLKSGMLLQLVWLPAAIPTFAVLLYKEFNYDPLMMIISLSSLVVTTVMLLTSDKLFSWSEDAQAKRSTLSGVTADNFSNIRTIKSLKKTYFASQRLKNAQENAIDANTRIGKCLYFRFIDVLCMIPFIVNIILAKNDLTMMAFIIMSDYSLSQVRHFISDICDTSIELSGVNKNLKDLDGSDTVVPPTLVDTLVLDNVIFDYGNEEEKFVIEHIEFPYKSRTLIHGSSGSGKSSLANLISGGIKPTTGNVPSYNCYYIWQETESLADTLWNNIVFDNEHNIPENEIIGLFKELNMFEWFCKLDKGFDTFIGEKGCRLSSGQKQRLNIIRLVLAMRYRPDYLFIIDEITSNLDDHTRELAIKLIDRECKSTLICISHNDGFDKICNHSVEVTLDHRFIVES